MSANQRINRWAGKVKLKHDIWSGLLCTSSSKSHMDLLTETRKFREENKMVTKPSGVFGFKGYRINFRKEEDKNFFLLVFNQYFDVCEGTND